MFDVLKQPLQIGNFTLKNRFVMSSMATGFLELNGNPNERFISYLERRAVGGVSMIIVESTGVTDNFRYNVRTPSLANDESIPSWRKLTERIKKHNCHLCVQLQHPGRQVYDVSVGETVGASPIAPKVTGIIPRPLVVEEIREMADWFGQAAKRAKFSGVDSVEIHAGHGYLFSQFLSPNSNNRTDEYGGSLENRFRFLKESIKSIKYHAGEDYPIIVRMSFDEFVDDGITYEEAKKVAIWLEKMGIVSIRVSGGNLDQSKPAMIPPTDVEKGLFWKYSKKIKEHLNIPVDVVGKIQNPEEALSLFNEGYCDYISIGRPLLADPDYVRKTLYNFPGTLAQCIACNQGCIDRLLDSDIGEISCLVNQEVGQEYLNTFDSHKVDNGKQLNVAVIGSGPSGLEAARVSAKLGHSVIVYEKEDKIGGLFKFASVPPGKEDFASLLPYYKKELDRLGVTVEYNTEVSSTKDMEKKLPEIDVVIWALGAKREPTIQSDHVVMVEDVYKKSIEKDKSILVYGAGWEGAETALYLHEQGYNVSVVTPEKIGQRMSPVTRRWYVKKKLKQAGIEFYEGVEKAEFTGQTCTFGIDRDKMSLSFDLIINESYKIPYTQKQNDSKVRHYLIGEAGTSKGTYEAIRDGYDIAISLTK